MRHSQVNKLVNILKKIDHKIFDNVADDCNLKSLFRNSNFEFIEDYGDGIYFDEDGNLNINVYATCLVCGRNWNVSLKIPAFKEFDLDLTKEVEDD